LIGNPPKRLDEELGYVRCDGGWWEDLRKRPGL